MSVSLPVAIRFGRAVCGDLIQAERREWWLANGLGAYAAGTVAGTLTRRYHGLLIAPVYPPLGRNLVLAKADAELLEEGQSWPLHTNRWSGGAVVPTGHVYLESFQLEGRMPVWHYTLEGVRIEQRIWLEPGANTVYVAFRLEPEGFDDTRRLQLRLRLLANARDHHHVSGPGGFQPIIEGDEQHLQINVPPGFTLHLKVRGGRLTADDRFAWVENFDLPLERERGLEDRDSHLSVGGAVLELTPGVWVGVAAGLENSGRRFGNGPEPLPRARSGALAQARPFIPINLHRPGSNN
ncbi:MAG: glycogen debranching enzyme N-terminal domain-containing protein [Candidatus Competibacteraceae bacterium]